MVVRSPSVASDISDPTNDTSPTYDPHFLQNTATSHLQDLSLREGTSGRFMEPLVNNNDLMSERERIKKHYERGKTLRADL